MTLSFIVPVFNAKNYLSSCVASLLEQGLAEGSFEILLVNDGSDDGSGALCDELAEKNPDIRVIHQQNKGVSEARNSGIRAARGDYLCFVDADDRLLPGRIASLESFCNGENDLVRFWVEALSPSALSKQNPGDGSVTFEGTGRDFICRFGMEHYCVCYLYLKDFLVRNELYFKPGLAYSEDFLFIVNVLMANPRLVSVSKRVYQYIIRPQSVSTSRNARQSRQWVRDLIGILAGMQEEMAPLRETDPALYNRCRSSMDGKMLFLLSRMLTGRYSVEAFREVATACRTAGLLPFFSRPSGMKERLWRNLMTTLLAHPTLYPAASWLYRRIFWPLIYPFLNKNA